MPSQTTAITQSEAAYIDTDRPATQSTAVQKKTDTGNYHLFRQASASKQPNRPLTKGKPRLGPSHNSINSALSAIKPPASWSSAPLLEALTTYCEDSKKADRLTQDLTKPGLRDFLSLDESELCLKQDKLTKQEFDTFIKALANEGHGSSSSLTKLLKKAWRVTQKESGAQQTSHTSVPLQEALIRYCKDNEKASCLKQDVTKPELRDFLSLDESVLRFKQAQLTKQEFDTFIEVLANAGHGSKSSLTKKLKTAWGGVQQAARDSAHPAQDRAHPASISILAPSYSFDKDKNSTKAPSETATTERVRIDNAPNKNADTYPEENNPFAGTNDISDTATTEALRTDSTLSKSAELNPNKYKIYADAKADSVEQTQPSNSSTTSSVAPLFLQLLNDEYLTTKGKVNQTHVSNIKDDIKRNSTIKQLLIWENGQLKWKKNNVTKDDIRLLLNEFKTRHDLQKSSLFQVLSNPRLRAAGLEILDAADYRKIIQQAAKSADSDKKVAEIKKTAITKALEFLSKPENLDKPLPAETLTIFNTLIEYYNHTNSDQQELHKSLEKEEKKVTLNDNSSIIENAKRSLGLIKTNTRIKDFSDAVVTLDADLRKDMLSMLKARDNHLPAAVAKLVENKLIKSLQAANDEASKMGGHNIFPNTPNAAILQQIEAQANQNAQDMIIKIIAEHEKKFVGTLTTAATSFSVSEYFAGKSREKMVDNIIAINEELASKYETAQKHHKMNAEQTSKYVDQHMQTALSSKFESLLPGLVNSIKGKILSNYQHVHTPYKAALDDIKKKPSSNFAESLDYSQKLQDLSRELKEGLTKISETSKNTYCANLTLQKKDLNQVIKDVSEPLLEEIEKSRLPKQSIRQTIKLALIEAFKPTPGRILGCIPLVGGLTIALSTLPKVIAIPLGITAGVVLPFALLGWVGWKIYDHFDQRSQIKHQNKQTLRHLMEIKSLTTK